MPGTIHYTQCPVCGATQLNAVFPVKDHTVSGEQFSLLECTQCTLRFTQDVPDGTAIGRYYKSEDYISHSHSAKGFINRIYYRVRNRTLVRKRKMLQQLTGLQKGRLLDVGSGTGLFAAEMNTHGWQVTGLEPDADARAIAKRDAGIALHDTAGIYSLPEKSFDAITLWHVLEHVHDLHGYIKKLGTLLDTNGRLFIAVPNYTSLDASIYREHWAAYDVPRHLYHFSPQSIDRLVTAYGMKILQHKPMWYDSFYISLVSSKYRHSKTNWLGAGWIGLRSNLTALFNVKKCSSVIYVIAKG